MDCWFTNEPLTPKAEGAISPSPALANGAVGLGSIAAIGWRRWTFLDVPSVGVLGMKMPNSVKLTFGFTVFTVFHH